MAMQYSHNCIVKVFPDGHKQIMYYPDGIFVRDKDSEPIEHDGSTVERKEIENMIRAKRKIYDLARSNEWDWFVTLTFDKRKVEDRYDYGCCVSALSRFCRYLRDLGCTYLFVPELHERGAYHFHGLVRGPLPVTFFKSTRFGDELFNCPAYTYGFSSVMKIRDRDRVASYITKYITKGMLETVPKGKRRYLASRKLKRPVELRQTLTDSEVEVIADNYRYIKAGTGDFGCDYWLFEE